MATGVRFEHGTDVFWLRFNTANLCAIEDDFRMPVQKALATIYDPEGGLSVRNLRRVFLHGLGGKLALDKVSELIDALGFNEVAELIGRAVQDAFPAPDDAAQGADAPGNGAGTAG